MAKFTLSFDCDNDWFTCDSPTGLVYVSTLKDMLDVASDSISCHTGCYLNQNITVPVFDGNGNRVGCWKWEN